MEFKGKLTGADKGYAGHGVTLNVNLKLDGVAAPVSLSLNATVADDGHYRIELPPRSRMNGQARLVVRSPDGARLAEDDVRTLSRVHQLALKPVQPVKLKLKPDVLSPALGPFSVKITLTGDVGAGRLVSIWGKVKSDGNTGPRTVLAAEYTDATGTVRLTFTRAAYADLEAEVVGTTEGTKTAPVDLDENGQPQDALLIPARFPSGDAKDDDCNCHDGADVPRVPEPSDLTAPGSPYSGDLADGTCPSPAIANRTLEEYRYFSLVRTTDPYLFGVKPKPPRPLGGKALGLLAELAYGFGAMDTGLDTPDQPADDVRLTRDSADREKISPLDSARKSSEAYFSSGLITARAWRDTAKENDPRKAILERAAHLSEDVLRHALSDPDGFTPVSLMTAERVNAIDSIRHNLTLFHDASKGRELISTENMPDWESPDGSYQAATIAHGHILEWRQVWRADGYSLGDLVYSLPLAPGQKRKVAVVDWDRDEGSYRRESTSFSESLRADLTRDRTVTEVVNSTVNESIRGGSRANTWAAGGGIGLGIPFSGGFFGLGVAGGAGGASSSAWQNSARSLSASAGQNLSDRTQQASAAVRSLRASVVVGAEQEEGLSITSEVVANYNHCHAMTMEYFEVLQHFRVDQELAHVKECLFIPLQMRPFNIWKALRWRDILRPYLRDRRWRRGFGAIERILQGYYDSGLPVGRYADEDITELSGELRLELDIARPREPHEDEDIDAYLDTAWDFWKTLFGGDSAKKVYDATVEERYLADRIFEEQFAPRVARAFCESLTLTLVVENSATGAVTQEDVDCDWTMVSNYRKRGLHLVSFRAIDVPSNIPRANIRAVRIGSTLDELSPNSRTILRVANIQYSNAYRRHRLVPYKWMQNDILLGDHAQISTRNLSRGEEANPREKDQEAMSGLIKHLNEFVEYYHQIIWWRMDPNRRFMLLDGFTAPGSGGRSLASVVENRLINIVGNALVMPVAPGYHLDPLIRASLEDEDPVDLLELYRPPIPFAPKRISLPTRGVHAEAILGECNSCEIRDDTRFWDWTSEPIPNNEPPEISEISTASRRQAPADTTPSEFPNPVVAIQNAPAAPDPTPISAYSALLGQEGLFKDVSGLEENQKNAIAAFQKSLKTANAFGKMAASGAKAAHANRNSDRVMRKVQEAESSGLLKKDDAKDVVSRMFGIMNGDEKGTNTPLNKTDPVDGALQSVLQAPGRKSISVNSENGTTNQTVQANFSGAPQGTGQNHHVYIAGIPPLQQPSAMSCWAVSLTMLAQHGRQQSITVETALEPGGQAYIDLYRADTGLPLGAVAKFRKDYGLRDASFGAITANAVATALNAHGPLWVIADENTGAGFSLHARVITGVRGDGSPNGTTIIFNDPSTGQEESETLRLFIEKIDQLTKGSVSAFGGVSPTVLAL